MDLSHSEIFVIVGLIFVAFVKLVSQLEPEFGKKMVGLMKKKAKKDEVDMTPPIVQQADSSESASATLAKSNMLTKVVHFLKKTAMPAYRLDDPRAWWYSVKGVQLRRAGEPSAVRWSDPERLAESAKRRAAFLAPYRQEQAKKLRAENRKLKEEKKAAKQLALQQAAERARLAEQQAADIALMEAAEESRELLHQLMDDGEFAAA